MVPTVGIGSLKDALKKADLVVFNISRNNEHTKNDHALLKTPLTDFFMNDFKGEFHDGFAASARISIPPTKRDWGAWIRSCRITDKSWYINYVQNLNIGV